MTWTDIDGRRLIGPGLAAAVGAVVLATTVYLCTTWLSAIELDYSRARAELAAAAREYRQASDDRAVYERYASRFRERAAAGWIGAEERLSWIEGLQVTNEELRLPRLEYEIGQQQSLVPSGLAVPQRLELRRTPMRLSLGALHEGDILRLLGRLRDRGNGLMEISYCSFDRNGAGPDVVVDPNRANIAARCELQWYKLQLERAEAP